MRLKPHECPTTFDRRSLILARFLHRFRALCRPAGASEAGVVATQGSLRSPWATLCRRYAAGVLRGRVILWKLIGAPRLLVAARPAPARRRDGPPGDRASERSAEYYCGRAGETPAPQQKRAGMARAFGLLIYFGSRRVCLLLRLLPYVRLAMISSSADFGGRTLSDESWARGSSTMFCWSTNGRRLLST